VSFGSSSPPSIKLLHAEKWGNAALLYIQIVRFLARPGDFLSFTLELVFGKRRLLLLLHIVVVYKKKWNECNSVFKSLKYKMQTFLRSSNG
jgi:hypothetical protein